MILVRKNQVQIAIKINFTHTIYCTQFVRGAGNKHQKNCIMHIVRSCAANTYIAIIIAMLHQLYERMCIMS